MRLTAHSRQPYADHRRIRRETKQPCQISHPTRTLASAALLSCQDWICWVPPHPRQRRRVLTVEKGGSAGAGQQEAGGDGARGGDGKGSSETGQRLKKYQIGGGQWRGGNRRRGRGLRSSRGEPQEEREDGVELKQGELVGKSREWIGTTTEASRTIHFVVVSSSGADENGGRKEVDDRATPRRRQPLPTAATSAR
jgi:hypothetical protein